MDSKFLKFWGHFLINVAEGQSQLEQMSLWMEKGFTGVKEMTDLFQRFYGPGAWANSKNQANDNEHWHAAIKDFKSSLDSFVQLWGWVPAEQYQGLKKKNEALQRKVAQQEDLIATLRTLLDDKCMGSMELIQQMQNLALEQNQQFQDFMKKIITP